MLRKAEWNEMEIGKEYPFDVELYERLYGDGMYVSEGYKMYSKDTPEGRIAYYPVGRGKTWLKFLGNVYMGCFTREPLPEPEKSFDEIIEEMFFKG